MGEILLWKKLRAGTMMTYSFNRQKPLNKYIVDFYCKPLNLVIEVDGEYHNEPAQRLKQQVRKDMEIVLKSIETYIYSFEEKHPELKTSRNRYR
mgnify:CR=1 FL=1